MFNYLEKSANKNFQPAIIMVADLLYEGKLVKKDDEKALYYYELAAKSGNQKAQFQTALMYYQGKGTKKNIERAKYWFEKSNRNPYIGHYLWTSDLCKCLQNSKEKSFDLNTKAMENYNIQASANILNSYKNQEIINPQKSRDALTVLSEYANHNNLDAITRLGNMYHDGTGLEQNYPEALKWYAKGAELGSSWCKMRLGEMYRDGKGVSPNKDEAIQWFVKSGLQGNIASMANVLILTSDDPSKQQFREQSLTLLRNYADGGNMDAITRLGNMYHDGTGLEQNYPEALKWYAKGAELGSSWCKVRRDAIEKEYNALIHASKGAIINNPDKYESVLFDALSYSIKNGEKWEYQDYILIANTVKKVFNKKQFEKQLNEINTELAGNIGRLYRDGKGVDKDLEKAAEWMRKPSEYLPWANVELFDILWRIDTASSREEMVRRIKPLAESGNVEAMGRLARAYRDGKGIVNELYEATEWIRKALNKSLSVEKIEKFNQLTKYERNSIITTIKKIDETTFMLFDYLIKKEQNHLFVVLIKSINESITYYSEKIGSTDIEENVIQDCQTILDYLTERDIVSSFYGDSMLAAKIINDLIQCYMRVKNCNNDCASVIFSKLKIKDKGLRLCQITGINLLLYLNEVCKKNNIEYWAFYGTLLGTIRHKGFIPWDDDIDLAMTRDQLNKLRETIRGTELDIDDFTIIDEFGYVCTIYKLHFVGIGDVIIDIFVMDEIGDVSDYVWIEYEKEKEKLQKDLKEIIPINKNVTPEVEIQIKQCYEKHRAILIDKYKTCNNPGIILGLECPPIYNAKYIYHKNEVYPLSKKSFENIELWTPNDPDSILKSLYTNYMAVSPDVMSHRHFQYDLAPLFNILDKHKKHSKTINKLIEDLNNNYN